RARRCVRLQRRAAGDDRFRSPRQRALSCAGRHREKEIQRNVESTLEAVGGTRMLRKVSIMMLLLVAAVSFAGELSVGDHAPSFALTNAVDGKQVTFVPTDGKLKVVVFTCNQCP